MSAESRKARLTLPCPHCGAKPGKPCMSDRGQLTLAMPHSARERQTIETTDV